MAIIADLTADQLVEHALNVLIYGGRQKLGTSLIYRCLDLQPDHIVALRCLSDLLAENNTEQFSAAILEYLLSGVIYVPEEERTRIEGLLFLSKWIWGFSKHSSGKTSLSKEDFSDISQFEEDGDKYEEFLMEIINKAGSLRCIVRSAHILAGVMAGMVESTKYGPELDVNMVFDHGAFHTTPKYDEFLQQSTQQLEELKQQKNNSRPEGDELDIMDELKGFFETE